MAAEFTQEGMNMDMQRRIVAYKTLEAWKEIPHVSYVYEPDITDFILKYNELKSDFSKANLKLSFNTIMLKVIAEGLKKAPMLNSYCHYDASLYNGKLITLDQINIGIPWLIENDKMITITAFDVGNKTLVELINSITQIKEKIKLTNFNQLFSQLIESENNSILPEVCDSLTPHDIQGGTITISNIGSICNSNGYFSLLEIISPQVFAVGISTIQEKPGVFINSAGNKEISIRKILPMCLVFDYKVIDFSNLIPFINQLDYIFKNPRILLDW